MGRELTRLLEHTYLMKLLNRCVLADFDIVEGAMWTLRDKTAINPEDDPQFLQLLVAVTLKHHNYEALSKFPPYKGSGPSIFALSPPTTSQWVMKSKPREGIWAALVKGNWIKASDKPDPPASSDADEAFDQEVLQAAGEVGYLPHGFPVNRPAAYLRSYLPLVSRSVYDGVSPHPKWPGATVVLKQATARMDEDAVEIVQLLVEIGGMDLDDKVDWWKSEDADAREVNPLNRDGSDVTETPLHIAVDTGNLAMVEYILSRGPRSIKDGHGRNQLDRAIFRGRPDVIDLFRKYGW